MLAAALTSGSAYFAMPRSRAIVWVKSRSNVAESISWNPLRIRFTRLVSVRNIFFTRIGGVQRHDRDGTRRRDRAVPCRGGVRGQGTSRAGCEGRPARSASRSASRCRQTATGSSSKSASSAIPFVPEKRSPAQHEPGFNFRFDVSSAVSGFWLPSPSR